MNNKNSKFLNELQDEIKNTLRECKISSHDFYEICREYLYILLNADFFKKEGKLIGNFKFKDIDSFINKFKVFSNKYSLSRQKQELVFNQINYCFFETATDEEKNALPSGMIYDNEDTKFTGYMGTFYYCNHIPNEIVDSIKERIFSK